MSKNHASGFHPSAQQQAAEIHELGAHTYSVAEQADDPGHLKPHERTRQSAEHHSNPESAGGHHIHNFGHHEIAALAYELWQARGCPEGSPEVDWHQAVKELRGRNLQTHTAAAKS
jgi:hypothetical protein